MDSLARRTAALLLFLLALAAPTLRAGAPPALADPPPRLVLLIAVDQMRYDYLTRFGSDFEAGLKQLFDTGAVFTNAHLDHYPSVTAVGHATMLTGALPSVSGIVGNDWYERALKLPVDGVADPGVQVVGHTGAGGTGASPHRLRVSTIGDELKLAGRDSRVITVSFKDRSAILMGGRMADAAYWYRNGGFVTSSWYRPELPAWAREAMAAGLVEKWRGREWRALTRGPGPGPLFTTLPTAPGGPFDMALPATAFGNEAIADFAIAALAGEGLGTREATDVLAVSFSCHDYVGHGKGPHSPEAADITRRMDRVIGRLLAAVESRVGLARTLVVLTADHGVSPVPEEMAARKMAGGRLEREELRKAATAALEAAHGPGAWVQARAGTTLHLNRALIAERRLDLEALARTAADRIEELPGVWRAYTRGEMREGRVGPDPWSRRVARSFDVERSGDVEVLLQPYWIASGNAATHGSPWSYDTHIPLILSGPGFRAGRYDGAVTLNDLAPTLATVLAVETPSGAAGRVLVEALLPLDLAHRRP
ncbi:MAG: alkaline phosphatase family protein [Vicinamibacteria bacterium]|nr:alkaline phosphatase family protein [Vicinamibacteria bacterium]